MNHSFFNKNVLTLQDPAAECRQIANNIKHNVLQRLHRSGAVIGISGGIDSSVTAALTVKALGADRVLGILMPEQDSSPDSARLAHELAAQLGIKTLTEDITGALQGFRCYERRDEAVRSLFPDYDPASWKMKIGLKETGLLSNLPQMFYLTVIAPDGKEYQKRLPAQAYRQIVAASNFKQRSRMAILYYHAEANHYAAIGTPNKHEVQQGFFVKNGDGGADVMPIAHLYKTQVYQLARTLEIPAEIIERTPTSDTYTAEQTQEEFFFQLPFDRLDLYWYAFENHCSPEEVGRIMGNAPDEINRIYQGFDRKIKTTEYLRMAPLIHQ